MAEKQMLGDFIYTLRKEKGLSQNELGAQLGVTNKAVSKWETGEANPDIALIRPLAEILGVSADELLACERVTTEAETPERQSGTAEPDNSGSWLPGFIVKVRAGEYVSKQKTKKGTPYVHINFTGSAKGIVAIGLKAQGVLALGLLTFGLFAFGLLSFGLLTSGAVAFGLLAAGGIAAGGIAAGGIAAGLVAVGGVAVGVLSVGGLSVGYYAVTGEGGIAIGIIEKITKNLLNPSMLNLRIPAYLPLS